MTTRSLLCACALAPALLAAPGFAQDDAAAAAPAPACAGPEFRQLDFWVGRWRAEWDNGDGTVGTGTNTITKDEYGDCVVIERFEGPGLRGHSVSMYHAPVGAWRQTWVDDQGGYFALVGGPVDVGDHAFELVNTRLSDKAPHLRMIWQNVTDDSFTWRWQNRPSEDEAWNDAWVIRYTRMAEEAE